MITFDRAMKTIEVLLDVGKKPAKWERMKHLSDDDLIVAQTNSVEEIAKSFVEYCQDHNISENLWDLAEKEAMLFNPNSWRYIHIGLMSEAIQKVRETQRASVKNELEGDTECSEGISEDPLTKAWFFSIGMAWITKHRLAKISFVFNDEWSERQLEYLENKLGVDMKNDVTNRVAGKMFLIDYNLRKKGLPNINTRIYAEDGIAHISF